jgi:hypothetical protein
MVTEMARELTPYRDKMNRPEASYRRFQHGATGAPTSGRGEARSIRRAGAGRMDGGNYASGGSSARGSGLVQPTFAASDVKLRDSANA